MDFLLLIFGLALLVLGSHFLIDSLKFIAVHFKLKPFVLSIVILGFVSSSPEWFVTTTAAYKNLPDAALGNILGSNIINILLILSLTGLFYNVSWNKQIIRWDVPILTASLIILGLFSLNQKIGLVEGLLLLGIFSLYLVFLFYKSPDKKSGKAYPETKFSAWKNIGILILGFLVLFSGSSLAVDSSLNLVKTFSLSERFAGVFILSLSTSLPELATSLQAAFKKESGMAVANIVGSNIFNTLFILGSASLLNPLHFSTELFYDYFFMLFVTLILGFSLLIFKNIPKILFGLFVISYFVYIAFVSGSLHWPFS